MLKVKIYQIGIIKLEAELTCQHFIYLTNTDLRGGYMARKGRETELLIKKLEEIYFDKSFVVKSPDHIYDKVAECDREVDVSISGSVGTHDILIVFECRNRKTIQDMTWIEQIHSKTKDIGANKVIAVSTSGFTPRAKMKATSYGIELRMIEDIDNPSFLHFLTEVEYNNTTLHNRVVELDIQIVPLEMKGEINVDTIISHGKAYINYPFKSNDHIFYIVAWSTWISLEEIMSRLSMEHSEMIYNDIGDDSDPVLKDYYITYFTPELEAHIRESDETLYRIGHIYVKALFWKTTRLSKLNKESSYKYASLSNTILEVQNYKLDSKLDKINFSIFQDKKENEIKVLFEPIKINNLPSD